MSQNLVVILFGGFTALFAEAGTNVANVEFGFDYDPFSDQISRLVGVGDWKDWRPDRGSGKHYNACPEYSRREAEVANDNGPPELGRRGVLEMAETVNRCSGEIVPIGLAA